MLWLTDKKGRRVGVPTAKLAYVEIGAPRSDRRVGLQPRGDHDQPVTSEAPVTVDLLDRRLLFVTGKGGVGKSTVAAALALLGASRGKRTLACEVDAKGDLADFFETSRPAFEPREVRAEPVAHVHGHRGVAAGVPPPAAPAARRRPARARWPGSSTSWPPPRPACGRSSPSARSAGRCASATTTSSWSTPRPPATSSASSPPPRPSTTWCGWARSASRPAGCSTSSPTRPRPAWSS